MLRRAANIWIVLIILAVIAGIWRGRRGHVGSSETRERATILATEYRRLRMEDDIGHCPITPEYMDRECELSARLALAECDAADDRSGREAAVARHLRLMMDRAAWARRTAIHSERDFSAVVWKADQRVEFARVWLGWLWR